MVLLAEVDTLEGQKVAGLMAAVLLGHKKVEWDHWSELPWVAVMELGHWLAGRGSYQTD